jgi:fatty acid/phospholipid biosynthesis enzyme
VYDSDFFLNAGGPAAPMSTAILTASHLRDANALVIVFWPLAVMMAIGAGVGFVAKHLINYARAAG